MNSDGDGRVDEVRPWMHGRLKSIGLYQELKLDNRVNHVFTDIHIILI